MDARLRLALKPFLVDRPWCGCPSHPHHHPHDGSLRCTWNRPSMPLHPILHLVQGMCILSRGTTATSIACAPWIHPWEAPSRSFPRCSWVDHGPRPGRLRFVPEDRRKDREIHRKTAIFLRSFWTAGHGEWSIDGVHFETKPRKDGARKAAHRHGHDAEDQPVRAAEDGSRRGGRAGQGRTRHALRLRHPDEDLGQEAGGRSAVCRPEVRRNETKRCERR